MREYFCDCEDCLNLKLEERENCDISYESDDTQKTTGSHNECNLDDDGDDDDEDDDEDEDGSVIQDILMHRTVIMLLRISSLRNFCI